MRTIRCLVAMLAICGSGCSIKTTAIKMVGNALASGNSVYETDSDPELVGEALPFGLKLMESLLAQAPDHSGLLLTACRGFVVYGYAYVADPAERAADTDIDAARRGRERARRLFERAHGYCLRGLEQRYPGFEQQLVRDAGAAAARVTRAHATRDVPWLYWTAASLGLAMGASPGDAAMLGRLPDVQALLDRALALDETWDEGALHDFALVLATTRPGGLDFENAKRHYDRAVALSGGRRASTHVAYAEAVALPQQDADQFKALIERALALDPDAAPTRRLATILAQRRARWLASRTHELILESGDLNAGGQR